MHAPGLRKAKASRHTCGPACQTKPLYPGLPTLLPLSACRSQLYTYRVLGVGTG